MGSYSPSDNDLHTEMICEINTVFGASSDWTIRVFVSVTTGLLKTVASTSFEMTDSATGTQAIALSLPPFTSAGGYNLQVRIEEVDINTTTNTNDGIEVKEISFAQYNPKTWYNEKGGFQRISPNTVLAFGSGSGGGAVGTNLNTVQWGNVLNKPFTTIGNGLDVTADALVVDLAAGDIPNLAASKITTGEFPYARLPISSTQVSNWDTAFGWGDHSQAGYASDSDLQNHIGDGTIHFTQEQIEIGAGQVTSGEFHLDRIPEIPNTKLANSTISGRELGTDLLSLSAGAALEYTSGTSYNGSVSRTIRIAEDGVTNAMLANSSLTVTTGTGLTGGGSIDLGGSREISFDQSYGDGRYGTLSAPNDWTALNTFSDDIRSDPFTTEQAGWFLGANGNGEFRNTSHDSIMTQAFIAEISQSLFGSDILTKSGGELAQDFVIPDFGFTDALVIYDLPGFKGTQNFSDGDYVRLQVADRTAGVESVWGTVTGYVDNEDGTQSWSFMTVNIGSETSQAYIDYRNAGTAQGGQINDEGATIALFNSELESDYIGETVYAGSWVLDYGQSGDSFDERTVLGEFAPFGRQVRWTLEPWDGANYEILTQTGNLDGLGVDGVSDIGVYTRRFYGTELIRIGDLKDTPTGDFFRVENGDISMSGDFVGDNMALSGRLIIPDSLYMGQDLFDAGINGIVLGTSLADIDNNAWFKLNDDIYFNVGGIITWKTGDPLVIGTGAEFTGDLTGGEMALTGALVSNSVHVGTFSNSLISSPTIGGWEEDVRGLRIDNSNYFIIGLVEGDTPATVLRVGGSEGLVFDATRPTLSPQLTLGENVIFDWGGGTLSSSGILLEKGNYSPLDSGNAVEWVDNNIRQSSIFHDEIIGIDGLYLESMTNNIILSVGDGSIDPDTNLVVREGEVLFGGKGLKNIGGVEVGGDITSGTGANEGRLPRIYRYTDSTTAPPLRQKFCS